MSLLAGQRFSVIDLETTGWSTAHGATVIEIARVGVEDGELAATWSSLVGPRRPVPADAVQTHGITEAMLDGAPEPAALARSLRESCAGLPLVFHNAPFDLPFLTQLLRQGGEPPLYNPVIDTLGLARGLFGSGVNALGTLAEQLGLPREQAHRALGDARTTARLLIQLTPRWEAEKAVSSVDQLAAASQDVLRQSARRPI